MTNPDRIESSRAGDGKAPSLTEEQIDDIAKPFIRELGGDHWHSGEDGIRDNSDLYEFARALLAAAPAVSAPAEITDEEIDRIAALTEKAMEDGLRGFCKTWGWQQFARTLVENLRPYGLRRVNSPSPATGDAA